MKRECTNCCNFTAYYEKAYSCFLRTECGNCSKKRETINRHASCENWSSRSKFKRDKYKVICALDEAICGINAIKLILEEERE